MGSAERGGLVARFVRRRACALTLLLAIVIIAGACGGGDENESAADSFSTSTTEFSTTGPSTTASTATRASTTSAPTTASTTIPEATTTTVGKAVGGNNGNGVGEAGTLDLSETMRTADGSCQGWAGGEGAPPRWTSSVRAGAVVRVQDAAGNELGRGTLGRGVPVNFDRSGDQRNGRWQCELPFDVRVRPAGEYHVQIADLPPMPARPDPTAPGRYVADLTVEEDPRLIVQCQDEVPGFVGDFFVVGSYWTNGFSQICLQGLRIGRVDHPCRPAGVATGRILSVKRSDGTLIDDGEEAHENFSNLQPGDRLIVAVASAVPCG